MVRLLPESITKVPTVTPEFTVTAEGVLLPPLMHAMALELLGTLPLFQFEPTFQLPDAPPVQIAAPAAEQAVFEFKLKLAVTVWLAFMVTTHGPAPAQAPLHPRNCDPAFGAAASVTIVPCAKLAEQFGWQAIPAGIVLVTVPSPDPVSPTASVNVGTDVPVPVRLTFWTLAATPLELSVTVREALSGFVVDGVKTTKIVQDALAASCPPTVLQLSPGPSEKSPALVPVSV